MSLIPKLMEINDELVRVREERDQAVGNAVRLQAQLAEAKAMLTGVTQGREHAEANRRRADAIITELQAELAATRKQLQDVLFEQEDISSAEPAGQSDLVRDVSHYTEAAEVDRPTTIHPPEYTPPEGWRVLAVGEVLREGDVRVDDSGACSAVLVTVAGVVPHGRRYIRPIEPQAQPEPEFKPYTFAAYIVGDKSQPDALRIVWATEEWIQHSQFGIVHRMRDMQFFGNDGGCNITEYHETLTLSLEVQ